MSTIYTTFNVVYQITGDGVPVSEIEIALAFEGVLPAAVGTDVIVSVSFGFPNEHVLISQSLPVARITYVDGQGILTLEGNYIAIGDVRMEEIKNATATIWYTASS